MIELISGLFFLLSPALLAALLYGLDRLINRSFYAARAYYQSTDFFAQHGVPFEQILFDKGRRGEFQTYDAAREFERDGSLFLFNLYLPRPDGTTTEVDLLLITRAGVVVIENKNYDGFIYGRDRGRYWCQVLSPKRPVKNRFLNPVLQNELHVRAVRRILEDGPLAVVPEIWSMIVFSDDCELNNLTLSSYAPPVVKRGAACETLRSLIRFRRTLTKHEVDKIYDALEKYSHVSDEVKTAHVRNIERRLAGYDRCPFCGAQLIVRTAKNGPRAGTKFCGCARYPDCTYTEDYEDGTDDFVPAD